MATGNQACFRRLGVLFFVLIVAGCSSYELRGRVVEGARASVEVVSPDDARLTRERGVADVELTLTLDPDRLSKEVVARGRSGPDGGFALPVDAPGAGVLVHDVEMVARRDLFAPSTGRFVLPGKNKRVLVTVVTGRDRRPDERSLLQQTIDEAEPFLRQ